MEKIEFGKIVTTHGIKGEIKLDVYTSDVTRLKKLHQVYVNEKKYIVESIKSSNNQLVIKLKGIDTIEAVQSLNIIGSMVSRDITQEDDTSNINEYFVKDLIGCMVYDEQENAIGKLTYVFQTGANDVYEITKADTKIVYVPSIDSVVKKINIIDKKIWIHRMEGLEL